MQMRFESFGEGGVNNNLYFNLSPYKAIVWLHKTYKLIHIPYKLRCTYDLFGDLL